MSQSKLSNQQKSNKSKKYLFVATAIMRDYEILNLIVNLISVWQLKAKINQIKN